MVTDQAQVEIRRGNCEKMADALNQIYVARCTSGQPFDRRGSRMCNMGTAVYDVVSRWSLSAATSANECSPLRAWGNEA